MEAPKKKKHSAVQNDPEPFPLGGVFAITSSGPLWVNPAWEYISLPRWMWEFSVWQQTRFFLSKSAIPFEVKK